jgi:hypothetical protein
LNEIKLAVAQWHPLTPEDFRDRFANTEVATIVAQAEILWYATLMIIRRLSHLFEQQDREGLLLSQATATELKTVLHLANRSIPCPSLAYLAGCFQIMDRETRVMAMVRSAQIITSSK